MKRCPFLIEWISVDSTKGDFCTRSLGPEDLLSLISEGLSASQIAAELDAPLHVVEHAIMMIPSMMAWRSSSIQQPPSSLERLPSIRLKG